MLNSIYVKNFRSISDSKNIKFSKLNILVGPNNSGKSSLLYAILMLKQSFEEKDIASTFVTSGSGVDLGSYLDFIRGHDLNNKLYLAFEIDEKIIAPAF